MKQGSNQKVLPNSGQPTKELRHGPNGFKRRALSPPKSPFRRIAQGTQTERFEGGIDLHDFFCPNPRSKPGHNVFRKVARRSQSGRSLGLPENFQRRDVAPNRQISRTDSRETWPPQNQTGPLWVIFPKCNRGEKHSIPDRPRSAVA